MSVPGGIPRATSSSDIENLGRRLVRTAWIAYLIAWGFQSASAADFRPEALEIRDLGAPPLLGTLRIEEGQLKMAAAGSGMGGRSDQFSLASMPVSGDFDLRVCVTHLGATHLWAKAGLMVRDGEAADERFAGVFTTPTAAGSHFQSRESVGGSATLQGSFPVNLPLGWLRLQRVGDSVRGYAGFDGLHWSPLGAVSLVLGPNARVGLAVTSHATEPTTAIFSDAGDVTAVSPGALRSNLEPPGPSSRRTAIVITEIMYHPADRTDRRNLEFVEIYNSQPYFEDVSGWKLAGEIQFTFPAGTTIPGGGYLVVAAVPADLRAVHDLPAPQVLGPYTGRLSNGGGTLQLIGDRNAVMLEVDFSDDAPWPLTADGAGHSLVLQRPSYGEGDPRAWGASRVLGGSPGHGEADDARPDAGLRINEVQFPAGGAAGFVELFNAGAEPVDVGGLRLGPSPENLPYTFAAGAQIPPGGFLSVPWNTLGWTVNSTGLELYLRSADATRFLDAAVFAAQLQGTSLGRWPNGGPVVQPVGSPTPGDANVRPQPSVVIHEIHANPRSGDRNEQFVELHNPGTQAVDLTGWEFTAGINARLAPGSILDPGGYGVLVRDAATFQRLHPATGARALLGSFQGNLSGRGETLVLSRPLPNSVDPSDPDLTPACIAVYSGSGRWSQWADEGGSTLELVDPRADTTLPGSWRDSLEADEAPWTTVEFTGVLDNGPTGGFGGGFPGGGGGNRTALPDSLHIVLMGEGECLIDNVEVIGPGNTNRIPNGTFEDGLAGWTFSGNHVRSSLEEGRGDGSRNSLHLRASNNGDTGANKIFARLSRALTNGNTATLRARVKWLRGWPEILLRLRGNTLEAYGRLETPATSGTPGAPNSVAKSGAGPIFGDVTHFPVVPAIDEPVRVTARVDDPEGVSSVTLRYRVDPETTWIPVPMNDSGADGDEVRGDGVYSASIPAPGSAKLVAFTIEAVDSGATARSQIYPPGPGQASCLVRFGDGTPSGVFGTYRLWVTQERSNEWRNRPVLSNEPVECTFVYGNSRAIHGAGGRFAGSPFHQNFANGPASDAHFTIDLPKDDRVLGAAALNKLHAPGNGAFDDNTIQREQAVYWLARQSGLPWLHRRYFHFYVNGTKKRTLMEDTQVGSDDFVEQFWPEDPEGDLFKLQPWFEFPDATTQNLQMQGATFVSFDRFTTTGGELKLARYRWNWLVRGADGSANHYTNALEFILTATDWNRPGYEEALEKIVDLDEWFAFFALHHAVGNWDAVGYRNQQNTYAYKPRLGRWQLVPWDANIALGNSGSDNPTSLPLFTTSDPILTRWFNQIPGLRRRYVAALERLASGPMSAERVGPMLDAKYQSFVDHGLAPSPSSTIKTWINSARGYILSQVARISVPFAVRSASDDIGLQLTGTGPVAMTALRINDAIVGVTWENVTSWSAELASAPADGVLHLAALDLSGAVIPGTETTLHLVKVGPLTARLASDRLEIECAVSQGGEYHLETSDSMSAPAWRRTASVTAGADAARVTFTIPSPAGSQAYFRVVRP